MASGFVTFWSPSKMQAVLGNHCAQSPASVWVASPGHALAHCKIKWTLCSGQQVWWTLHWGLCSAVQVACEASSGFVTFWNRSVMEAVLGNHCAQSAASV